MTTESEPTDPQGFGKLWADVDDDDFDNDEEFRVNDGPRTTRFGRPHRLCGPRQDRLT